MDIKIILFATVLATLTGTVQPSEEPQIIEVQIVEPVETPAPRYNAQPVTEYDWTDEELKQVAKVLWAETGKGVKTLTEKQCICYLILNRVRFGDPFPSDIVSVCRQRGEFNRGKFSQKNADIARDALNAYQSQLDGNLQNIRFPVSAVYMARKNGVLTFYDWCWNVVWEVK